MRRQRSFSPLRLAFLLVAVVPVLAWFVVKPVRVVLPELAGVQCVTRTICTDDPAQLARAQALYSEALDFVRSNVSVVSVQPRVVFCATQACADRFGLGARSAVTLGTWGTVIGPNAWKPFYVRHEMIHVAQAEHLGVLSLLRKPSWFVEGMAYGLSQDPRAPLAEPFEGYRRAFFTWYEGVGKDRLWGSAAQL